MNPKQQNTTKIGIIARLPLRIKLTITFLVLVVLIATVAYYQIGYLQHLLDGTVSPENAPIINQLITFSIISAGIAAGSTIIIGVIVARMVTRNLGHIQQGARRIANGDFSTSIPVRSNDEFGEVITAFNQMSLRLKDSYRRLALETRRAETLLESMGEGIIALDEKGDVLLLNRATYTLLEIDPKKQWTNKRVEDTLHIQTIDHKPIPEGEHPGRTALATSSKTNETYTIEHKDGKTIIININASPVVIEDRVAGVILLLRDVTKEKEIDRMKTEFISLASHQLRTPLSAIKWFSEMLVAGDAGKLKAEQLEFAQNIATSTERMIELVTSLLNISRIESGRIVVEPHPTDLKEMLDQIIIDLKAKTQQKMQTMVVSVHKDLPKINLDNRLISQVYLNLLTNAIKYTPKGGEITVFISKKDDQVISQVSDSGYGIPKAEQGKVFQRFFRAQNAAKIETDGTGLGLYLVKAIIESSGGKIWFKSEENKGTTFWFSLPLSGMKAKEGEVTLDM